jgi:hypothetical protein
MQYGATTEDKLQNISREKKEFAERLTAKGVCDLLFVKYVKAKKRKNSGSSDEGSRKKQCFSAGASLPIDLFSESCQMQLMRRKGFLRFPVYKKLYEEALGVWENNRDMVVMGTPGTGKSVFGLYCAWRLLNESKF